jgi:hypothetical protein
MEIWKDIIDYEGLYQISSFGRIKSLEKKVNNSETTHRVVKERIMRLGITPKGYIQTSLAKKQVNTKFYSHRLVALHFIPNPHNKLEVNHIDGNKSNNEVSNLEWSTRSENNKHAFNTGLRENAKGSLSKISKLSQKDREDIKASSLSRKELRIKYNVSATTIQGIKTV